MSQVGSGSDPHGSPDLPIGRSMYRMKESGRAAPATSTYSGQPDLGFLLGQRELAAPLGDWPGYCVQPPARAGLDETSQLTDASFRLVSSEDCVQSTLQSSFEVKGEADAMGLELRIKETQNESLENEIQRLRSSFNEALNFKQAAGRQEGLGCRAASVAMEVPQSMEDAFRRLSMALHRKSDELAETKDSLESVLTALALDPTNSLTRYGRYDAEALAHKVVARIETLTRENQELARMLAYGRAKEMQIQLQLARLENSSLSDKVSGLQQADSRYQG